MAAATVCRPPGAARRAVCAASRSRKSLLCGVSLRAAAERPPLATLAAEPEASSSSTSTTEPDNAAAVSTVQEPREKYYERIGGILVEFDGPPKPNEMRGGRMPDAARVRGEFDPVKAGTLAGGTLLAFVFVLLWVTRGFGTF